MTHKWPLFSVYKMLFVPIYSNPHDTCDHSLRYTANGNQSLITYLLIHVIVPQMARYHVELSGGSFARWGLTGLDLPQHDHRLWGCAAAMSGFIRSTRTLLCSETIGVIHRGLHVAADPRTYRSLFLTFRTLSRRIVFMFMLHVNNSTVSLIRFGRTCHFRHIQKIFCRISSSRWDTKPPTHKPSSLKKRLLSQLVHKHTTLVYW